MTTYFISRHRGACDWIKGQGIRVDRMLAHLEVNIIQPGDVVIGTLPVNLAAQVCARGGRYLHLSLDLPAYMRGCELSADDMSRLGARLEAYRVEMGAC